MTYNRQHARHGVSYLIEARQSLARLLVHIEPSIDLDHHGLGTWLSPIVFCGDQVRYWADQNLSVQATDSLQ